MTDAPSVHRDDDNNRFVLTVDGEEVGFAQYSRDGSSVSFTHTEVDPALRGKGLAEVLAADALAEVARDGDTIVPLCPFIAEYLRNHDVAGAVVDWPDDADAQDAATPGEAPA